MADRPILMSGPMVRAILREIEAPGTGKTMTRRIIKGGAPAMPPARCHPEHGPRHPAPYLDAYCGEQPTAANPRGMSRTWCWWQVDDRQCVPTFRIGFAPGDRLWVRETHYVQSGGYKDGSGRLILCRADTPDAPCQWTSSIHMPRWASRLTLVVTGVQVERLNSISPADVRAEGIEWREGCWGTWNADDTMRCGGSPDPIEAFRCLWINIHGTGAWDINPWVCAVAFTPHPRNIDAMDKEAGR